MFAKTSAAALMLVVRDAVFDTVYVDADPDGDCDAYPEWRKDAVACWSIAGGVELDNAVLD